MVTGTVSHKFVTKMKQPDMSKVLLQFEALLAQSGIVFCRFQYCGHRR
jgi:hypothetical protein